MKHWWGSLIECWPVWYQHNLTFSLRVFDCKFSLKHPWHAHNYQVESADCYIAQENESKLPPGRKRAAPRGRGRGSTQSSKRGRKSDNSSIHRMLMNDDDDDDEDIMKRLNKSQPRVCISHFPFKTFVWIDDHPCRVFSQYTSFWAEVFKLCLGVDS